MSGYRCRDCGTTRPLFPGQAGAEIATAYGIPLLARLPFAADIAVTDEAGEMVAAVRECIE